MDLSGINSFEYTNVSDSYLKEQPGGSLEAAFTDTNAKIEWVGSSIDLLAVLFWVLIAAGCVMLVIGVLKSGVIVVSKAAPAKTPDFAPVPDAEVKQPVLTVTPEVSAETAEPETTGTKPAFCEECGAPLPAEGLFCENCGAKIKREE